MFLCRILPKIHCEELSRCNEKRDAFNHMLNQHNEQNEPYQVTPLNAILASKKNMTAHCHKNIQLNNAMGFFLKNNAFLKNLFLSFLLTHSDLILRVRKRTNKTDPEENFVFAKIKIVLRANDAKPYRSPN